MASILDRPAARIADDAIVVRYAPVLATTLAALGILAIHIDTVRSIVAIWERSETFAHGYVVVPIALWLAWRKRDALARVPARPWLPALALVAGFGAVWLVMTVADVLGVRQFALAFMLLATIVSVVGLEVARAAAFPLLFVLFAVPAGEFMVPTLIEWTADFTVAALRATGVPVFREANHFVIPSGSWSVVEACSGLRYLIASVMVGVVYAAVSYRSPSRRAAFVAASVLVPLVANWLRAYMIVMIGHLSNNRLAVGVDHLIYGWLFFGVVMALLFWVGSFWSEPEASAPVSPLPATNHPARSVPAFRFYAVAVAAIAVAGLWRPLYAALERPPASATVAIAAIPAAGEWSATVTLPSTWTPGYSGFDAQSSQGFVKGGVPAGVHIVYYRNQRKGHELVTSGNRLVRFGEDRWKELGSTETSVSFAGAREQALRSVISTPEGRLVAYRLFWVDGVVTGSEYDAKARLAWSRLRGGSGEAALIVAFAPEREGRDAAREALEALAPSIARSLDAVKETR